MKIESCPIVFHDLIEIVDFLTNLSPALLFMFDGCIVDMLSYKLQFRVLYVKDCYYITYYRHNIW